MTDAERRSCIERLRALPQLLAELVAPLSDEVLLARPIAGEWSVAQNVHHVADSHMNAYIRTRLILTEDHPAFRPYKQELWAELADASGLQLDDSLEILAGLHRRWVRLLESLPEEIWQRTGYHPENLRDYSVEDILTSYADHGEAHLAQIQRNLDAF